MTSIRDAFWQVSIAKEHNSFSWQAYVAKAHIYIRCSRCYYFTEIQVVRAWKRFAKVNKIKKWKLLS